jgi:hypothetical protein
MEERKGNFFFSIGFSPKQALTRLGVLTFFYDPIIIDMNRETLKAVLTESLNVSQPIVLGCMEMDLMMN